MENLRRNKNAVHEFDGVSWSHCLLINDSAYVFRVKG